jgi:hypothetical protein
MEIRKRRERSKSTFFIRHPNQTTDDILRQQQKEMEPSSQSTLAASGFSIRSLRLDDDLQAVRTIFQAGMRLYCDPLPVGSVVKKSWEGYIRKALEAISQDFFKNGLQRFGPH